MTPTEHGDLIERLNAATGPDRALDYDLHEIAWGDWLGANGYARDGSGWWSDSPPVTGCNRAAPPEYYTTSVDAALALVERLKLDPPTILNEALEWLCASGYRPDHPFGPQYALALCIATLEALRTHKGEG